MKREAHAVKDWLRQPVQSLDVTLRLRVAGASVEERELLAEQLNRTLAVVVAGHQPTRAKVIRGALLRLRRQTTRERQ